MLQRQGLVVHVARIAFEDAASFSIAMGAWACGTHWQQVAPSACHGLLICSGGWQMTAGSSSWSSCLPTWFHVVQ